MTCTLVQDAWIFRHSSVCRLVCAAPRPTTPPPQSCRPNLEETDLSVYLSTCHASLEAALTLSIPRFKWLITTPPTKILSSPPTSRPQTSHLALLRPCRPKPPCHQPRVWSSAVLILNLNNHDLSYCSSTLLSLYELSLLSLGSAPSSISAFKSSSQVSRLAALNLAPRTISTISRPTPHPPHINRHAPPPRSSV